MLKSKYFFIFQIVWIISWTFVAANELNTTKQILFHTFNETDQDFNEITMQENYEEDLDFVASKKTTPKNKENFECKNPNFWGSIESSYNEETNIIKIDFNKVNKQEFGIKKLELVLYPRNELDDSSGFKYYNINSTILPLGKDIIELPLNIYKTDYKKFDFAFDRDYNIVVKLVAHEYKDKYKLIHGVNHNTGETQVCHQQILTELSFNKISEAKKLRPFFKEGVFDSVYLSTPDLTKISEDIYIENYLEKQNLKKLNKDLPPINEAAVALLSRDIESYLGVGTLWGWSDENIKYKRIRTEKTVIGLFGDIHKRDLETVQEILITLNIVAPDLDISYGNSSAEVNLPIHFTPCTKEVSQRNNCLNNYAGFYHYGDWIWIDSTLSKEHRKHVLVHEIGHALGLGHNLCFDSVMSYADHADNIEYFSTMDLMQLRALYYPSEWKKMFPKYAQNVWIDDLINMHDLDKEKIHDYKKNISTACPIKDPIYDSLINGFLIKPSN